VQALHTIADNIQQTTERRDYTRGPRRKTFHRDEPESLRHKAGHDADRGVPPRGDDLGVRNVCDDDDTWSVTDTEVAAR
jgi:hypothetical protein